MDDRQTKSRIEELARTIAYANILGVRADVNGDAAQKAEAKRIYSDAKEELARIQVPNGGAHRQHE